MNSPRKTSGCMTGSNVEEEEFGNEPVLELALDDVNSLFCCEFTWEVDGT